MALGMSVRRAQAEIDSVEFAEWQAIYGHIETFGEHRADVRSAIIANALAACHGAKTELTDFMPYIDREKVKQSEEAKVQAAKAAAAALGVLAKQRQV